MLGIIAIINFLYAPLHREEALFAAKLASPPNSIP